MDTRRGVGYAIAAFCAWGLLSPGNEILLRQVTPLWLQSIRAGLATLALAIVWGPERLRGGWALLRTGPMFRALLLGTFLSFGLFVYSQTRIPAAYTTLGFYTAPLWTAILARPLLGERVGFWFGPAVGVLLLGGWMALTGAGDVPPPDTFGMILAIGSGAVWGAYAVLLRRDAGAVGWRELLIASMLLGLVGFTVLALLLEPLPRLGAWTQTTWAWTAIQALIPTVLALGLFQRALRLAPAGLVNILVAFELAATVFFAWLLLDFVFGPVELAGVALCLVAVSGYLWSRSHDARREQAAHGE